MTPSIGELFAGYGGLGMGVQSALGGRIAWVSDLIHTGKRKRLTGPARILSHRFPDVPNLGDVTQIDWTAVERPNILTGGSPCQDISNAGRLAGMTEGTRSNLWVAMRSAIEQLEPDLVVWENVGGALNAGAASELEPCPGCVGNAAGVHMRALGRVLGDLATLGLDAEWVCVRAADAGAPHGRLRVFVTAWPSTDPRGIRWVTWGRDGTGTTEGGRPPADPSGRSGVPVDLLPTPAVNDMGDNKTVDWWDAWTAGLADKHGNSNGHGKSLAIEAKRLFGTPRASDFKGCGPKGSKAHTHRLDRSYLDAQVVELGADEWGPYAEAVARWEALTRPAPTPVEEGRNGNPRLAAVFPEWMMGLPAGWVTDVPGITRTDALKALGNGVVPQQAALAIETMRGRILD